MSMADIKYCRICGTRFEPAKPRQRICNGCQVKNFKKSQQVYREENFKAVHKQRRRVSTYNVMPVRKFVILLDRYNEKHKTKYTYGQAMQCLADGTIDEKEFYSSEE